DFVGEGAQRHQHADPWQQRQLTHQEGGAVVALCRLRAVGRRRTADGGCDVGAGQLQAVVAVAALRLIGVAGTVERSKEPVAGAVAGEDAARTVASVSCRRQADDEKFGLRIAEARQRPAPVLPAPVGGLLLQRDLLPPGDEPRAAAANDDLTSQLLQEVTHELSLARNFRPDY